MNTIQRLFRDKGFLFLAIAPLALGLGANAAMFSLVDAILIKPLRYPEPEKLFVIRELVPRLAHLYPDLPVNARHFEQWQQTCDSCQQLALIQPGTRVLTRPGAAERLDALAVTAEFLPMLGLAPLIGRPIRREDERVKAPEVVLLSYGLWQRRFEADPDILGSTLLLDGLPHEVIGVLPPALPFPKHDQLGALVQLPSRVDAMTALSLPYSSIRPAGNFDFAALVRVGPNAAAQQALKEMDSALSEFSQQTGLEMKARLVPLDESMTGGVARSLWLLQGAVGAVLLIVCLNLGNILLVRLSRRRKDLAIRKALGASSLRLSGMIVGESIVLALVGGAVGALLAFGAVRMLVSRLPVDLPRLDEVSLDMRAVFFVLLLSVASAVLVSVLALWRLLAWHDLDQALRQASPSAPSSAGGLSTRSFLVGLEVALSVVLLVAAGLLVASFMRLMSVETGFEASQLLAFDISLPNSRYRSMQQRQQFHDRLLAKISVLPGVASSGLTNRLPLEGESFVDAIFIDSTDKDEERPVANYRFVSPGYFRALKIELRQGRYFEERDRGRRVALVSRRVAERLWPGKNPVGRRIRQGLAQHPFILVVGVVDDVRMFRLEDDPSLIVYQPFWQSVPAEVSYALRILADPGGLRDQARKAVWELDPQLAAESFRTMGQVVEGTVAQRRFRMRLAVIFAISALVLACLGVYGVVSYSVSQRRHELGIRMALGANPGRLSAMVLQQGMLPVLGGLLAGLAVALALGRLLKSLLFEVQPDDFTTLVCVTCLLLATCAAACYIPARKASKHDPMIVLRSE